MARSPEQVSPTGRPRGDGRPLSRRRQIAFSLIPAALLLIGATSLGEVFLRLKYGGRIERITGAAEWKVGEWEGLTYFWDQYHPRLGWTNLPGYVGDERVPFSVSINRQGLRGGREYASRPPAGVERIAVFGDSFVFGEEVDDDQTLPSYLERHLARSEVVNFGVHGYGLGQMMIRLEEEGFALNPDRVVVVLLVPEDIARDPLPFWTHAKPAFTVEGGELHVSNVPVPAASRQPWLLRRSFVAASLFGRRRAPVQPAGLGGHLDATREILARIDRECSARGIPWTLVSIVGPQVVWDMRADAGERELVNAIRRSLLVDGLDVFDATDFLDGEMQADPKGLGAPRGHWSGRGNCLLALQIARHLAMQDPSRLPVPGDAACAGPSLPRTAR